MLQILSHTMLPAPLINLNSPIFGVSLPGSAPTLLFVTAFLSLSTNSTNSGGGTGGPGLGGSGLLGGRPLTPSHEVRLSLSLSLIGLPLLPFLCVAHDAKPIADSLLVVFPSGE